MENVVVISMERFEGLLRTEVKLNMIESFLRKANRTYGYGSDTSEAIDNILGIERPEEEK